MGAEVVLDAGVSTLPAEPEFEHGVLVVDGSVTVAGQELDAGPLQYLATGREPLELSAGARLVLIGGPPFPDELVMWWNFGGRSHQEFVEARDARENRDRRFGPVDRHGDQRIPAPPLPPLRLTPRRRVN